jgi:DtxR family Mn-dependent transcriptional regulator
MLKSLSESGFVDYVPYRGARLTAEGQEQALKVIRNHRLIEAFLVRTLGYSWDEVHDEAEQLEHAISDRLAERIDAYLGHPEVDPHGDPIPRHGGVKLHAGVNLLEGPPAPAQVVIQQVINQDPDVLRYLTGAGLIPGAVMEIRERLPFDGPLRVRVSERPDELILGRTLARGLLVGVVE